MAPCDCAHSLNDLALNDLVNDPLTRLLMKRDGVEPAELIRLMNRMKLALSKRRPRDLAALGRGGASRHYHAGHPSGGHPSPRRPR